MFPLFLLAGGGVLDPLTYAGADRTLSVDGDLILIIQGLTSTTWNQAAPTLPTGFTSVDSGVFADTGQSNGGDQRETRTAWRISYAISNATTRTTSIASHQSTLVLSHANADLGVTAITVGSPDLSSFTDIVGIFQCTRWGYSGSSSSLGTTLGTVDSAAADNSVVMELDHSNGTDPRRYTGVECRIGAWLGNFIGQSPLLANLGSNQVDSWYAVHKV